MLNLELILLTRYYIQFRSDSWISVTTKPYAFGLRLSVFYLFDILVNIMQVEIVMGLEEEFGISVEEESAQSIATVQDAANMIEDLIEKKDA